MQLYIHCEERETGPSLDHDVNSYLSHFCTSWKYAVQTISITEYLICLELLYIGSVYSYTWLMSLTSAAKISPLSYLQLGSTALHVAAQKGKADVVRLLTEAGAQLDIQTTDVSFCFHNN